MKTLIKSLFPRALMHVTVLPPPCQVAISYPRRRHRWRHYITTVTAATNTIAPSRPYLSPRLRPPPPPPASRLPAPLSPARGRTRGTARACAASGRHSWWSVGQADGAMVDREHEASTAVKGIFHDFCIETLYWTAVWFVGAVVLWQWCGSTTRPCVPRNLSMLHSFGFCLLC